MAIILDTRLSQRLECYTYVSNRIVSMRIKIKRGYTTVIGAYALEEETEKFYNMLQKEVDKSVKTNHLIIAALNTRVGNIPCLLYTSRCV